MRRPFLLLLFLCLFLAVSTFGQRVLENESSARIDGADVVVTLVVESDRPMPNVQSRIELINTADETKLSRINRDTQIAAGKQSLEYRIALEGIREAKNGDLAWYRLRYAVGNISGIVSMSQLLRDAFELRIVSSSTVFSGMTYRVNVRAVNPFSGRPTADVDVEAVVELALRGEKDEQLELKGSGRTDADGFATLDLNIPIGSQLDDDGEITITGRKNGIEREAFEDIEPLRDDLQLLTMTDKPIYQPGQSLNIRGILLKGAEAKTILSNAEVEFRIYDEDDTLLYREKGTSSSFGIAAISWQIPANVKLGRYRIGARDADGETIGSHSVTVTRYDLPNFSVLAKPSKPYDLPADREAEIEIRADYLFGRPVTKGKVRVVEETSRQWNWKEQKYDIDEGEVREGETDAAGKFTAKFDLRETHEELKEDGDDKYEDLKFAAYFTDATTNKTEQRRFDVRVSREPIHVYLVRGANFGNAQLPMVGYVSTFYPDGTPARCDVEIRASKEDENKFRTVAKLRTNSFGGGKFVMPRPNIGDDDDDVDLRLIARDAKGRRGALDHNVYFEDDEHAIRISTDRSIYKPGETVIASIESTIRTGTVYVDAVSGWSVLDSAFATLRDGKAVVRIPYRESFKGQLKMAAYTEDPEDADDLVENATGIIFPAKQGISVDANFDKAVYKPNDEATVRFGVLDVAGRASETALGVVVFDKSVEERARTDGEFNGMFRNLAAWLGYGLGFGGVNVKDLNDLDLARPISEEMQLVGEIILHDAYFSPKTFRSNDYVREARSVFEPLIRRQVQPVAAALADTYERKSFLHPVNDQSLISILEPYGIDPNVVSDPWGEPFRYAYTVERSRDVLTITSNGPDKLPNTADDIVAHTQGFDYFIPLGRAVDAAVRSYNARTGDVIRTQKNLFAEMRIGQMLDRFGKPYSLVFDGTGRNIRLQIVSAGADGRFNRDGAFSGDDFTVWTTSIDLFAAIERKITRIQTGLRAAPVSEEEFKASLRANGLDIDTLRDGNGRPLYLVMEKRSRYWDKVTIETVQNFGESNRGERRVITPVTQQVVQFTIKGVGNDGKRGGYDDVTFTQYVHVLTEQSKDDPAPVPVVRSISFEQGAPNSGAIAGTVTDANGAVVPAASLTAKNGATGIVRTTVTNGDGRFLFAGLAAGTYEVRAESGGFRTAVYSAVPVRNGTTTNLTIILEVGTVSSSVEVTVSGAETVDTSLSTISQSVTVQTIQSLTINGQRAAQLLALQPGAARGAKKPGSADSDPQTGQQTSTPRLREYFPETLFWQPEVVTNSEGKAEIRFRMADNITTWKMYTIASTRDGKIGFAEKEVAAFQSFFVDLDPPKFLTVGDEIFLPTQVRNYTDKKQDVNVTMAQAEWLSFIDSDTKQVGVGPGGSENAVFGFKAVNATGDGRQRVTAIGQGDSDAIERAVAVRPDGHEVVQTDSKYFTGSVRFDLNFPANALPNTQAAELKIYPNLMAHVAESVEGLLRRPYGCGEQTISSTYPNVMILKFALPSDSKPRRISESVERKARKFAQRGYERLLGYQVADGGFSYWGGKDQADFALTAYALRFLADASQFVAVDPEVIRKAQDWLIRQQRADGSWNRKNHWEQAEDERRAKTTTTYVARTLAMLRKASPAANASSSDDRTVAAALAKALAYLKARNTEIDDPYSLSLLGLAAADAGDEGLARTVAGRVAALAKDENGGAYWSLESNTAFNGWGSAGRIETTALATQLLMRAGGDRELMGRSMIYLLQNKDRYGVWHSTQTTVNVLDTFVGMIAADSTAQSRVEVILNGRTIDTIEIGPDKLDQIIVNLKGKIAGEANIIQLRTTNGSPLMVQLVADHYIPWQDAGAAGRTANRSRAIRLDHKCDRTEVELMQEVTCTVEAERIGFRGYGMLLAEIGTPPGADVSRESLDAALESDSGISRYDVLPDRVIAYMWARPGGTRFSFKFRPRYGINAKTPASMAYDYYNPEAQAVTQPIKFQVR